jgi:hypothetical protein
MEGVGRDGTLKELYRIGNMTGMISGIVINQLLQWTLHDNTDTMGHSPHRCGDVSIWNTLAPGSKDWSKMKSQYAMFVDVVGSKQVTQ